MSRLGRLVNRLSFRTRLGSICERVILDLHAWHDVRAFPPLAAWGAVHCVALMLLVRRAADPSSLKLTATQISQSATFTALLMIAVRALLARIESRPPSGRMRFVFAVASAVPIITLIFGSARRLPLGTSAYLALMALGVGLAVWLWNREVVDRFLLAFVTDSNCVAEHRASTPFIAHGPPEHPDVSQPDKWEILRMTRTTMPEGTDRLEGVSVAEFAAGQSTTTLHIPFHPAFSRAPNFECQTSEGAAVRIKGSAAYTYGGRIELKRSGNDSSAARVEVRFSATLDWLSRAA